MCHRPDPSFKQTEDTIEDTMGKLTQYYRNNSLHANPDKTHVTAIHPRNKEAKREVDVTWNGTVLENTARPKYLGVILDRTGRCRGGTRNNLPKEIVYI